jgi:hypothetical protein
MERTFRRLITIAACMALLSIAAPKIEAAPIFVGLGGQQGISTNRDCDFVAIRNSCRKI